MGLSEDMKSLAEMIMSTLSKLVKILHYLVNEVFSHLFNSVQANISGNLTTGTIFGLNAFTNYSCTVMAVTVSNGPPSNADTVTTLQTRMILDYAFYNVCTFPCICFQLLLLQPSTLSLALVIVQYMLTGPDLLCLMELLLYTLSHM